MIKKMLNSVDKILRSFFKHNETLIPLFVSGLLIFFTFFFLFILYIKIFIDYA